MKLFIHSKISTAQPLKFGNRWLILHNTLVEGEVDKLISNFREGAAGWDELKPTVFKSVRNCISSPLSHICNLSFVTGIFPDELKIANVVSVFESGDEMVFSNYRPVSVLSFFSKVIERLMYNRLLKYINDNNLLYKCQFGFHKGKATHMALIVLIDKIYILLQKIIFCVSKGTILSWFENYQSNIKQYVTYNSIKSTTAKITVESHRGPY